jgi:hypothetical protein
MGGDLNVEEQRREASIGSCHDSTFSRLMGIFWIGTQGSQLRGNPGLNDCNPFRDAGGLPGPEFHDRYCN